MYSILIAGGDMRQIKLAKMLEHRGYDVYMAGFDKKGLSKEAPSKPDYVFLPIPYKNEDGSIKSPFAQDPMYLADIVSEYPESVYILGGCDAEAKALFGDTIRYSDMMQNEAYQIRNAMLTAQGAICAYLKSTDTALCDATCLVTGYGRIGKFLCKLLRACSADVIATARKDKDLELICLEGYGALRTKDLKLRLPEADVIFNTVPFHVIGEAELGRTKRDAKFIELASPPYGMDMELAKKMGVNVQIEPGLPGRYFPASAAGAILRAFEGEEHLNGSGR
jgi:dipicolinate synthase subunit A